MEFVQIIVLLLIILGAINMLGNIIMYILFLLKMRDVISGGVKKDLIMMYIGLILIVFFFGGYIFIAIVDNSSLITGFIMFFGSIFVTVVILLLTNLINTSKVRSLELAQILVDIIDAHGELYGHSTHVKNLILTLYKHMPRYLKADYSVVSLEFAALLHDIGNLNVPEEILLKNGDLTPEEWEKMKTHPQVGVRLLRRISSFEYISNWILYHHERVDGKGYYFKKSDSIPVPSKMLAICDAYSSMTIGRVYNPPKTHEEAIEELKRESDKQFDKELVDIFAAIPKKEIESCVPKVKDNL